MNELKVIDERVVLEKKFRIYGTFDNPLFLAKNVAEWIDYDVSNVSKMLKNIDEDEKTTRTISTNGSYKTEAWFLTEDGLYEVLMQSRKPIAKEFKKEVKKILKTIRKTGGYISNSDLMVNTYFSNCDETSKQLVKGLLLNIEEQQAKVNALTVEIEYKNETINSLTKNISIAEKRQVLNRVVRYNTNNYQARWNELYRQFELKYHCDIKRRMDNYNKNNKPKVKSKLDYIDKVMNKIPELYELACKLYASDVEALLEEMYGIVNS